MTLDSDQPHNLLSIKHTPRQLADIRRWAEKSGMPGIAAIIAAAQVVKDSQKYKNENL